uniref:Rho associated coiled coil n=1 Tax=Rhipicephalus appendiculatus TaxID=34631 RepID=A0A131YXR5_RHIAP
MKSDKDGPESGDARSRAPSTSSTADGTQDWYETDLQLAAELGKTLLERNQELEETVRQQQLLIEEQEQELQRKAKKMQGQGTKSCTAAALRGSCPLGLTTRIQHAFK